MLPPDDRSEEPAPHEEPDDGPRHPFTYRAPAEKEPEPPPLTPEDVAIEARRNDAVLVWATGLIAVVFACTTLTDSRVLVHVKTGRHLAANGVLPPGQDVLSATVTDRPWVNLSWLFDLVMAGLHAIGGFAALTVFQVVAAVGVVALILGCRRAGVSSWWAAFVVVLATVAAVPQLQARPQIVTLLGLGATLWLLTRYRQELDNRAVWWLVPLFLVWSNLDPRMFLGLAALVLYGLGELIGAAVGRPGFEAGSRRGRYWLAVGGSVLAALVNPFTWRAPAGAVRLYGTVDPAYREYYGGETSWAALPHLPVFQYPPAALLDTALLAGMLLAAVALVALLLNRRRLDFGDLALWLGFVGLGVVAIREWPAAAIVFAVLAIQNAQDWYRSTFRQTYGTERGELIFSRGGRALTVIAFASLAGLWLMGKIVADDGRRPGFGLDGRLAGQVASLSEILEDPFDRRVFNFQATQGDLLIWLGHRPFIDHRLELYGPNAGSDESLIALHDDVRHALRAEPGDTGWGKPEIWKPVLDRFGIVQTLPRLTFPGPDYITYFDLLQSPDWQLTELGAAAAVFYRTDVEDPELAEYLSEHRMNLTVAAFREPDTLPPLQLAWPRPRTWSDSLMRPVRIPNELARAMHDLQHLELIQAGALALPPEAAFAFAYMALRDLYAALAKDPQNVDAYRGLGRVYEMLYLRESQGTGIQMQRRLYQAFDAYGQALTIAPDDHETHERLMNLYLAFNKADLAARARDRYEALTGREPPPPANVQDPEQWEQAWEQLRRQVREVTNQARNAIEQDRPRLDAALFAWQNGCTLLGLELIEADPTLAEQNLDVRRLRAIWLLEAGRPEEAFEELTALEVLAGQQGGVTTWREPLALASLALPDYERAAALWRADAAEAAERQLVSAMRAVPMAGPLHGGSIFPVWQTAESVRAIFGVPEEVAQGEFNAALCELESGKVAEAEKSLGRLLDRHPLTPFTPLAAFYLEQIRGKPVELDLTSSDGETRFEAVEARLDGAIVTEQLKTAGPVVAEKPGPGMPPRTERSLPRP